MGINFNTYNKEQYKNNFNYYSNFFFKFNNNFLILKKNNNQLKKKVILFFFMQADFCFNFDLKKYLFLGLFLKINNNFKNYLINFKKKNFKFLFLLNYYYKNINNKKIFIINNNNIIFLLLDFNSIKHLNSFFSINNNGISFFNNILFKFFFFKELVNMKKKFFIYKNFYLYHLYWNSKEHSKLSEVDYFTSENLPPKNLWKIFSITDPLLTFRSKIDEEHKETDLFIYKYSELKNKKFSNSIINHSYKNSIKNYKNLKQIEVDHELYKITRKSINKTLVDTYNKKLEQSREKIRIRDENHELYKKKVLNSIIRRFSKNYSLIFLKKRDFFDTTLYSFLLNILDTSSYRNILFMFHLKASSIVEIKNLNKIFLIYKIFFFFLKKNLKYYFKFLNLLLMFSNNFFVFYNFQLCYNGRIIKKKISKNIILKIANFKKNRKLWILKNKRWVIFKRKPINSFINFKKINNYKGIEFFTKYSNINFKLNYLKKRKHNFKNIFFLEHLKKKFLNSYFFLNKKSYFIFHDWNYSIESYFRISEFRQHFININFLASKSILNKNQIFLFATRNLFLNTRFFFNYIYDYWLMRLLLSNNNFWKWINIYFISPIKFYTNSNLFFNLINFYRSNVIIPFLFSSKHYALILKKSKRSRVNNIAKIFYRISNLLFDKIFIKNYIVVIHKTSFFSINKKLLREINDLVRNNKFDIIRYNFVEEFTGICISTFVTKDPKFLIRWVLKVLLKIHFKKQWKFLHQVKINILKIAKKFLNNSNFMGIYIVIKGKIGSLGSVRKKNFKIKFGTFGFSRFYLRGDEMFSYAQTQTGKIGMKVITAYL